MSAAVVTLSEAARARMLALLALSASPALLLAVDGHGCGGLSYVLEPLEAAEAHPGERVPLDEAHVLVVGAESLPFLIGTRIDWVETALSAAFAFDNPLATMSCGCGSSFSVGG